MIDINVTPEMVAYIVGQIAIAGAIYGGIRSDIKNMNEKIAAVKSDADKAHERLDRIYAPKGRT